MTGSRITAAGLVMIALAGSPAISATAMSPFRAMAGNWLGGGIISMADGQQQRMRCRASYDVAGDADQLRLNLRCASDSYRFDVSSDVTSQGDRISGNWSEASRNVSGTLQGRGGAGVFEVVASTAGFNANIVLRTAGNKQSVTMRADTQFRGAAISLSR